MRYKSTIWTVIVFGITLGIFLLVFSLHLRQIQNPAKLEISSTGKYKKLNLTNIELADTDEKRTVGLMNRSELCQTCGMLFVFENSEPRSFWMKNTLISLDIIFMDEEGIILNIEKNTIPLNETLRYNSIGKSKYVLEVNAGYSHEHNLKSGDKIKISELISLSEKTDIIRKSRLLSS